MTMRRFVNRRSLAVAGLLITTQLLTACVVVPAPYYRPRGAVIVQPGYGGPYHHHHYRGDGYYYRR
jgi:hypothetical protein